MIVCIKCMESKTGRFIQIDVNRGQYLLPAMVPVCGECWDKTADEDKELWSVISEFIKKGEENGTM